VPNLAEILEGHRLSRDRPSNIVQSWLTEKLNEKDLHGRTALINAVRAGMTEEVEKLIQLGASLDLQDAEGNTALMYAAEGGKESLQALLDSGANADICNKRGETALHCAAFCGYQWAISAIIKARPELNLDLQDHMGRTALFLGFDKKYGRQAGQALLDAGADPNIPEMGGETILERLSAFYARDTYNWLLERSQKTGPDIARLISGHAIVTSKASANLARAKADLHRNTDRLAFAVLDMLKDARINLLCVYEAIAWQRREPLIFLRRKLRLDREAALDAESVGP
jgi:ankyrin repeat protein